jgi:hypothetical protein
VTTTQVDNRSVREHTCSGRAEVSVMSAALGRWIRPATMNGINPTIGSQIRVGEGVLEDLLRRAVYGPDDQRLQPDSRPIDSIESRHDDEFAANRVTGFMT